MSPVLYYICCGVLSLGVLFGIYLMSKVKKSVIGNRVSAVCMALAVILTLLNTFMKDGAYSDVIVYVFLGVMLAIGGGIGLYLAKKVQMIQMPQMVALLNGLGGAASAFVGGLAIFGFGLLDSGYTSGGYFVFAHTWFTIVTSALALVVGVVTLVGSLVAAGKLHRILPQKAVVYPGHKAITFGSAIMMLLGIVLYALLPVLGMESAWGELVSLIIFIVYETIFAAVFGYFFAIRVGGADMPITISLLNSLSGVAGAIAGLAVSDLLLVAVGGIVGASGLLLTQIMCKSMNRKLMDILMGGGSKSTAKAENKAVATETKKAVAAAQQADPIETLRNAKDVIIVPGYGMAIAQAQHLVKQLADTLVERGAKVRYAVHPVAGRMPGHMNVLLCEANVDYEDLYEMEVINDDFAKADAAIVIGANDVMNPAAREAEGTPIYGMPVLNVDECKNVYVFNYDTKPGYAGVDNPIYKREGVHLYLGNAAETLSEVLTAVKTGKSVKSAAPAKAETKAASGADPIDVLRNAKDVIIVPGYGMAIAQAQHLVKNLADTLVEKGAKVRYAVHPVAGRMPGHMNVLLCEANVDYEDLYEMEVINDDFAKADAAIVIGANDVMNPAAREAEGTPIYGMPVLNVDQCKNVFVFNYDTKPGYAGVDNPIYSREGVHLYLGNAAETLAEVLKAVQTGKSMAAPAAAPSKKAESGDAIATLKNAKDVIIVPGYGMAIAQAQHLVKQLADTLVEKGAKVRYAVHPVAGRMPGHMNVLLCEANVDYEDLYEMEVINGDFAKADAAIVIGANDVMNPAAREAEGTPIYGMPVLNVDECKNVYVFNYDTKPGYAGVDNPLYTRENVHLYLGNAAETLAEVLKKIK